jgi:hypothetical protein
MPGIPTNSRRIVPEDEIEGVPNPLEEFDTVVL